MSGKLFGIGIGPGDPELMTLKAKRILEEAGVIVFPGEKPEKTVAYGIISKVIDLSKKQLVGLSFPMTKDKEILEENHRKGAETIRRFLEEGKTAAFPTLGDPGVYATYIYVHKRIRQWGYDAQIIPGVPSFCAAAAKISEALAETDQELHIIPSSYGVEDALKLKGTKVLMKAGSKFREVYEQVRKSGQKIWILQNIGMENERIYCDPEDEIETGYYTLIIVKEK